MGFGIGTREGQGPGSQGIIAGLQGCTVGSGINNGETALDGSCEQHGECCRTVCFTHGDICNGKAGCIVVGNGHGCGNRSSKCRIGVAGNDAGKCRYHGFAGFHDEVVVHVHIDGGGCTSRRDGHRPGKGDVIGAGRCGSRDGIGDDGGHIRRMGHGYGELAAVGRFGRIGIIGRDADRGRIVVGDVHRCANRRTEGHLRIARGDGSKCYNNCFSCFQHQVIDHGDINGCRCAQCRNR